MKTKFILSLSILTGLILGSCATSNEVGGGGIFQKRKYNKGIYWNRNQSMKELSSITEKEKQKEEVLSSETNKVETLVTKTNDSENNSYVSNYTVESSDQAAINDEVVLINKRTSIDRDVNSTVSQSNNKIEQVKNGKKMFERKHKNSNSSAPASNVNLILLVILAIILPPLAVFLYEGASKRFVIDLILWIVGWGIGFWLIPGLAWACSLAAVIYALLIVLEVI